MACLAWAACLFLAGQDADRAQAPLQPVLATEQVSADADDPAFWIHPSVPGKSLILGTDKIEATGGLYAFDLAGKTVQRISGIDRPNNVDIEYGFELAGTTVDLAVVTERGQHRLRVFAIDRESGKLRDVSGATGVFAGREGEAGAPMGVGLWKRPGGETHAFVSSKTGPMEGYLHQYRLVARNGLVDAVFVRTLGTFSGEGEIEALFVDDEKGRVFYCDEDYGIRWAHCDPATAGHGVFGTQKYQGDREGIALWRRAPGGPALVNSEQVKGGSQLVFYPRDGGAPRAIVPTTADDTDGLDIADVPLPGLPDGALVMMNSKDKNFLLFDLRDVRKRIQRGE
ncbi:MAG: phytase [Fimbriimonadaceae bacterium]